MYFSQVQQYQCVHAALAAFMLECAKSLMQTETPRGFPISPSSNRSRQFKHGVMFDGWERAEAIWELFDVQWISFSCQF